MAHETLLALALCEEKLGFLAELPLILCGQGEYCGTRGHPGSAQWPGASIPLALQTLVFPPVQQELGLQGLQGPACLGEPESLAQSRQC